MQLSKTIFLSDLLTNNYKIIIKINLLSMKLSIIFLAVGVDD